MKQKKSTVYNAALLVITLLGSTLAAYAQSFDLNQNRPLFIGLDGFWRFHTGDNPRWADPSFDDSKWELLKGDQGWSSQGYSGFSGTAWYRAALVQVDPEMKLSLYVPAIHTSYQIFADGKLVGGQGGMPPHERVFTSAPAKYLLPTPIQRHSILIAIRVWHPSSKSLEFSGGLQGGIRVGESHLIDDWSVSRSREQAPIGSNADYFTFLEALSGLFALSLFAFRPKEREYLWFALSMLLQTCFDRYEMYEVSHAFPMLIRNVVTMALPNAVTLATTAFYFRVLHAKRDWLLWTVVVASVAPVITAIPAISDLFSNETWDMVLALLLIPSIVWFFVWLIRRFDLPDARFLLIPSILGQFGTVLILCTSVASRTGWYHGSVDWFTRNLPSPFSFSIADLFAAAGMIGLMAVLVRRFTKSQRQEEKMAAEFEAARSVQKVLIPHEVSEIPGFKIQSVYRPFDEVGGDFFQIIPARGGGVLAVIGDVSGKGMPAAMTVSLLIGTVRTLAHFTNSPSEILSAMNLRMLARSAGGFTTCLVLHAALEGSFTVANAGHIEPYLNGKELPLENGLPLGLAADATYPESIIRFAQGEQLTLMTDGIVEARNRSGSLFGFERTREIAGESADYIAKAALDFGQEDDMTVLTIVKTPVSETSLISSSSSDLSPSLAGRR